MRCSRCLEVISKMRHITPIGWMSFAWGPQDEDPCHYYVFPESEKDVDSEVSAKAICTIENPVSRKDWMSHQSRTGGGHEMIKFEKLAEIINREFGPPFLPQGYVRARIRMRDDEEVFELDIGRRSVTIDSRGVVTDSATNFANGYAELVEGGECPVCRNGTLERVANELRCRGECGNIFTREDA